MFPVSVHGQCVPFQIYIDCGNRFSGEEIGKLVHIRIVVHKVHCIHT